MSDSGKVFELKQDDDRLVLIANDVPNNVVLEPILCAKSSLSQEELSQIMYTATQQQNLETKFEENTDKNFEENSDTNFEENSVTNFEENMELSHLQHDPSSLSDDGKFKGYTCKTCNRSFGYKHVLRNHELIHTGEKPYKCKICHNRFARGHHLKTHMIQHTGERPFR